MLKRYSIAEARIQLPSLVRGAEAGRSVEVTRRGKTVAAIVSVADLERLKRADGGLWNAISTFRKDNDVARKGLDRKDLKGLRDRSEKAREFGW